MIVAHLDLDAFRCGQVENPELRSQPLIVEIRAGVVVATANTLRGASAFTRHERGRGGAPLPARRLRPSRHSLYREYSGT